MKLKNYKKGYIEKFDCSIHGTIEMTAKEWREAYKYLLKNKDKLYLGIDTLKGDIYKRCITTKKFKLFNVRITATELIAKKFNLKGYKAQNYQLKVLNEN